MNAERTRRPRVLIIDDNVAIIAALEEFFRSRSYEVFSSTEPVTCPLYGKTAESCDKVRPCADIMLVDLHMPRMSGAELLKQQAEGGCKLGIDNKAIMSSYTAGIYEDMIRDLGCSLFYKPLLLSALPAWLTEREKHFDLSQPLADLLGDPSRLPSDPFAQ